MAKGDIHAWEETGEVRHAKAREWHMPHEDCVCRYVTCGTDSPHPILRKLPAGEVVRVRGGIEGAVQRVINLHYSGIDSWSEYRTAILGPEEPEPAPWMVEVAREWCAAESNQIELAKSIAKHAREADDGE